MQDEGYTVHKGGILRFLTDNRIGECDLCGSKAKTVAISPRKTFKSTGITPSPLICTKCLEEMVTDMEQGYAAAMRCHIGIDILGGEDN